jgi:hypothetical protein
MRYFLVLFAVALTTTLASAQLHVNVNFNVDRQPIWGPAGYDHVEYYYLPDIEVYYNVSQQRYYYYEGGRWIGRASLPERYRGFDLYNSHKVVVNEPSPYRHHVVYREKYSSFKGRHDQQPIRDSRDERYFVNKNHPQHQAWAQQQKHDNGNGRGNGNKKEKQNNGNDHGNKRGRERE